MNNSCIASIDQGTSSTRVLIVNYEGEIVGQHQTEHTQYYPSAGLVEHDALQIWNSVKICLSEALASIENKEYRVVSIGITNQRETTLVWNKETGTPYHRAIVWNDNRTGAICDRLTVALGGKDYFRARTGLPIAPYFSATKIVHLLETVPGLRADAEAGKALFGTIDTWLMWKLTGGRVHATDVTNASRTNLMDLATLQWDADILATLDIPREMLPAIRPSNYVFGSVDTREGPLTAAELPMERYDAVQHFPRYHTVKISGVLGDQQAALFGQTCFQTGDAKCTYGTGAFLLMNTGGRVVPSSRGLLTTVAYKLAGEAQAVYALEGSVAYCGSLVQWLRDNLCVIRSAKETEEITKSVRDNGGVYFVPAFAGLYAPYWRQDARGIIAGLTAYNTKAHVVRAALEAAAFQTTEVVQAMLLDAEPHSLPPMTSMRVDGGMTANNTLMQFQSDLLDLPLLCPKLTETTALGAAYMAGLGVGLWRDLDHLCSLCAVGREWVPDMREEERSRQLHQWKKALARSLGWVDRVRFDVGREHPQHPSRSVDPFVARITSSSSSSSASLGATAAPLSHIKSSDHYNRCVESPPPPSPQPSAEPARPTAVKVAEPPSPGSFLDSLVWLTIGVFLGIGLSARHYARKQ